MKKWMVFGLTCFLTLPGLAGTLKPGFRDLVWRSCPTSTMTRLEADLQGFDCYTRSGDSMQIGTVKLSHIIYMYYRDQLAEVGIETEPDSFAALLLILKEQWGEPDESHPAVGEYGWTSTDSVLGGTTAVLKEGRLDHRARLVLTSSSVGAQKKADDREKAKTATGDL